MSAPAIAPSHAQPIHDEVLPARALHGRPMLFRVRLFANQPFLVALLTDLDDENPGCSITNGIEYAVAAVLERWPGINANRLVFVEHYDDREKLRRIAMKYRRMQMYEQSIGRENGESFALVSFGAVNPITKQWRAHEPQWKHATKAEVEALIGGTLP